MNKKRMIFTVTPELHKKLKVYTAENDISMQQFIEDAIRAKLLLLSND